MRKFILFFFILGLVIASPFFKTSSVYSAQGSIKGIFDAINQYRNRDATGSSLQDIKQDLQDLNRVKNEVNKDMVAAEGEFFDKSEETVGQYLDKWTQYLEKVRDQSENYGQDLAAGIRVHAEEELLYVSGKKEELTGINDIGTLRNFVRDLRAHRQSVAVTWGEVRSRLRVRQMELLENRLNRLNALLNKFEDKLKSFEDRGIDTASAQSILAGLKNDLATAFDKLDQEKNSTESGRAQISDNNLQLARDINLTVRQILMKLREIFRSLRSQLPSGVPDEATTGTQRKLKPTRIDRPSRMPKPTRIPIPTRLNEQVEIEPEVTEL